MLAGLLLAGAAGLAGLWLWRWPARRIFWSIERGLDALATARTLPEIRATLSRWEQQTGAYWQQHRDELLEIALEHFSLDDPRLRHLLAFVGDIDYGDRPADWQRWLAAQRDLRRGRIPRTPRDGAITLHQKWQAPVGLTAPFSTILPIDGQVYVASLGASLDDPADAHDGVARVDGRTGQAELFFEPPDRPPRDLAGLCAAHGRIYAASRNGFLYALDPQGRLTWRSVLGAPAGSAPLALTVGGEPRVAIVTRTGRVLLLSAASGKLVWSTQLAGAAAPPTRSRGPWAPHAVLAAGRIGGPGPGGASGTHGPAEVLMTTVTGRVALLEPSRGRARFLGGIDSPACDGAIIDDLGEGPTSARLADIAGRIWTLAARPALQLALDWTPSSESPASADVWCGVRGAHSGARGDWVVTGAARFGSGATVTRVGLEGIQWRWRGDALLTCPVAVADLNGGEAEIVLAGRERAGDRDIGVLLVLSSGGHLLARVPLPAPARCGPVISDVDGDGLLEVLVADATGRLHCFGTRGVGPVEWGLPGGDIWNTRSARNAYAYGQRPFGYQWSWQPE